MKKDVYIYDTTLRDGEQGEFVSYSLEDKVRIAHRLDEFGVDYIEGGWPGSNPKAMQFFDRMKNVKLRHAKLAAFGSTRRKDCKPGNDPQILTLIEAGTPVVTIFGKTWDLHVREALRVSPEENLAMIFESVEYLKGRGREVIYDAEHFFDGFKSNPEYALETLKAAERAGASCLVLCDTNGGTMPTEIPAILKRVREAVRAPLGMHTHNDAGMAVANTIMGVAEGAVHVQGTMNGYGERCGNADLIQVIPNLELKYNKRCLPPGHLKQLTQMAHFIAEVANIAPDPRQPYVGQTVFAHKGGIHVSAVRRNPLTYEHIPPETVGNRRRVLVSELSGQSNVFSKAEEMGIDLSKASDEAKRVVKQVKALEAEGYQFEGAEASFELLVKKALGQHRSFFELQGFRVITSRWGPDSPSYAEAIVRLKVNGEDRHCVADGDGPVNALDRALRKALVQDYPEVETVHLTDFKVRVLDTKAGTAAKVRVMIESSDSEKSWTTVGVSENIIEASYAALVDSVDYQLLKVEEEGPKAKRKAARKPTKKTKTGGKKR
ncbi:MAG: citramalate synthase [Candidatus Sumerlaeaceae bacterium]|nr:citramalate synthase [Candidatus Sumerlaeaceae bacterium]